MIKVGGELIVLSMGSSDLGDAAWRVMDHPLPGTQTGPSVL